MTEANAEFEQHRCRISTAVWTRSDELLEGPWLSRGAVAPRLYARRALAHTLVWSEALRTGTVLDDGGLRPDILGWTGRRMLTLTGERVESYNSAFEDRRLLRTAPPSGAADLTVLEVPGRAALVGQRVSRGATSGVGFVQILSAEGEASGPLRVLIPENGSLVSRVRARWDFGRVVVNAVEEAHHSSPFWVLDAEGALLHRGSEGTTVACPRGGCLRVTSVTQGNSTLPGNSVDNASVLQVEALDTHTVFTTNTPATGLRAVAVSGDRVLVMMSASGGAAGCDLRVIDVSHREVVGDGSDFHSDGLVCDLNRVRPIPRGFQIAVSDAAYGVGLRTIECGR